MSLIKSSNSGSQTKYASVAKVLRREIEEGVWAKGGKIPSELELAKRFNVAYMTVRQAVSSLVVAGELERRPRKGTFVVDRPPTSVNRFALLLQGASTTLDPYYLPPIVEAMETTLCDSGAAVTIFDYKAAIQNDILDMDAILCCVLLEDADEQYAVALRDQGHRIVAINRTESDRDIPWIAPDNEGGARAAVEHLIELGHRRIGFVRGLGGNLDAIDRRSGYLQAMANRGLEPGPEAGDRFSELGGYEAVQKIWSKNDPPTALFCAGDLIAIGALKALAELGVSVPNEVSVVGFGDFPLARFWHPDLTTVRLPLGDLGRTAAERLMALGRGQVPENTVLPCELIVRGTSAPAKVPASSCV